LLPTTQQLKNKKRRWQFQEIFVLIVLLSEVLLFLCARRHQRGNDKKRGIFSEPPMKFEPHLFLVEGETNTIKPFP